MIAVLVELGWSPTWVAELLHTSRSRVLADAKQWRDDRRLIEGHLNGRERERAT
jgi:hypothetical protein